MTVAACNRLPPEAAGWHASNDDKSGFAYFVGFAT